MKIGKGDILISTLNRESFTVKAISNKSVFLVSQDGKRQIVAGIDKLNIFYQKEKSQRMVLDEDSGIVAYRFFFRDAKKEFEYFGLLPERRRSQERINDESVTNWGRKYFGKNAKDEDIFFVKTVLGERKEGNSNLHQ